MFHHQVRRHDCFCSTHRIQLKRRLCALTLRFPPLPAKGIAKGAMSESEWKTRKLRIDAQLRSLSPAWEIIPWKAGLDVSQLERHIVTEIPTENGPADYGFFVKGAFLAILEAKKVAVNPQNVLEQAKRYSAGAFNGPGLWNGYRVPFLFASKGEIIWFLDVRRDKAASRILHNFHTAPALEAMFAFDPTPAHDWLLDTPPDTITRLRDYQRRCNIATEQAIIAGCREILLALATGTGKTFLTVAQIYRLLESKLIRRVLFLVDRKALAAQAVREFNAFTTPKGNKFSQEYEVYSQKFQKEDFGDDDPFDPKVLPNEYLTNPSTTHTFVYVSTIQRMARNLFGADGCFAQSAGDSEAEADADRLDIPIHAFDLVLVDECHRGYTVQELSIHRATINHFDGIKIGLTATPAAHTTAVFGPPVFRYTVEQAILDGFLVDYEAVGIKSQVRMNGVFLKEGETVERVDTDSCRSARFFPSRWRCKRCRGIARDRRRCRPPARGGRSGPASRRRGGRGPGAARGSRDWAAGRGAGSGSGCCWPPG